MYMEGISYVFLASTFSYIVLQKYNIKKTQIAYVKH